VIPRGRPASSRREARAETRAGPGAECGDVAGQEPTVAGVDGCAGGWVAVTLAAPGAGPAVAAVTVAVTVAATLDGLPLAAVTGIDMPLGLLADGWRDADRLARRALGRRGVTVFAIPPRPVWQCPAYAEANRVCRELTGKGLAAQSWGLRRKIFEADEYRRRALTAGTGVRLYEVHPELAFAALAGAPLPDSKHTKRGLAVRRGLLAQAGILLPPKAGGAAENDLLDAAAVAWSARRIAAGQAVVLANPAQQADDGAEIAVRY
jgi:predicted RNase H-like nuclease